MNGDVKYYFYCSYKLSKFGFGFTEAEENDETKGVSPKDMPPGLKKVFSNGGADIVLAQDKDNKYYVAVKGITYEDSSKSDSEPGSSMYINLGFLCDDKEDAVRIAKYAVLKKEEFETAVKDGLVVVDLSEDGKARYGYKADGEKLKKLREDIEKAELEDNQITEKIGKSEKQYDFVILSENKTKDYFMDMMNTHNVREAMTWKQYAEDKDKKNI